MALVLKRLENISSFLFFLFKKRGIEKGIITSLVVKKEKIIGN